jgi:hypothetical protein
MGAMEHAVALAVDDVAVEQVAVGEHDGEVQRVADKRRGEAGHHVGAIDVVSYVAKALGFTLRDKAAVGTAMQGMSSGKSTSSAWQRGGPHLYSPIRALFSDGLITFSKSRRKRWSSAAAVPSKLMRKPPDNVGWMLPAAHFTPLILKEPLTGCSIFEPCSSTNRAPRGRDCAVRLTTSRVLT